MSRRVVGETAVRFADALVSCAAEVRHHARRYTIGLALAVGTGAAILILFLRLHNIGETAIVVCFLIGVAAIATQRGFAEALASAIAAGLLVIYFVLPPFGSDLSAPQHWAALTAFLLTAVATSQLSIRVRKKEREAVDRQREQEKLYSFGCAILQKDSFDATVKCALEHIIEIFDVEAAAFYHQPSEKFFHAGRDGSGTLTPSFLREAADRGSPSLGTDPQIHILPVRLETRPIGSLGLLGGSLSETMARAIAQRVGIALERARVLEEMARAEAIRKSEELRSLVLDALAHDIKTPLTSIKAAVTGLLSERSQLSPSNRELLSVIDEETDRLNRFMNEAVDTAQMETGILRLERREYDIEETVRAALEDLAPETAGRSVQIDCPESLPHVNIDYRLVKHVLKQLLDNALKYSVESSPVVVTAQQQGRTVVVQIKDSGPGIPLEEQPLIFGKFYRGRAGRQRAPGTGMGLAIAKRIVEEHGCRIWVVSRPGSGSVFHVSLPIHEGRVQ